MNIKYRIIEIDEENHSCVVRFYTDKLTEDKLTALYNDDNTIRRGPDGKPLRCRSDYNLTIWDPHADPDKINAQIRAAAPHEWFKILEHMQDNETTPAIGHLKARLQMEHNFIHQPPPQWDKPTDAEIDAFISRLTAK